MTEHPSNSPEETKQTSPAAGKSPIKLPSRNRAMIVSIASSALLVTFALYTLLRTDFETYPEGGIDIADVTAPPKGMQEDYAESVSWDDEPSDASDYAQPSVPLDFASSEPLSTSYTEPAPALAEELEEAHSLRQELERQLMEQNSELATAHNREVKLAELIQERDDVIAYLQVELDSQQRRSAETDTAMAALGEGADIRPVYESLLQEHSALKDQYGNLQQRYSEREDSWRKSEQSLVKADTTYHELSRRYEGVLRDNARLQDRITDDERKFSSQELTFRELRAALKSHKEALRRMDNARIELASELDATKSQYGKLLQAVADRAKDGSPTSEIDALVASASEQPAIASAANAEKRYHVVKKGDTLSGISRHYYGSAQKWHKIYETNQAILTDHNRLKVGLVLVIP